MNINNFSGKELANIVHKFTLSIAYLEYIVISSEITASKLKIELASTASRL